MATERQKDAARKNIKKAQEASHSGRTSTSSKNGDLSTADRNDLPDSAFAFTKKRKEPLVDAKHVRNAISRFDQVEDVTDTERDAAWRKIKTAAKKHGVEISESGWRELFRGGKAKKSAPAKKAAKTTKKTSATKAH